jgi:hypothetical protein
MKTYAMKFTGYFSCVALLTTRVVPRVAAAANLPLPAPNTLIDVNP